MVSHRLLVVTQTAIAFAVQRSAPERWLSVSEQERLTTMALPARRAEFIACRYALRLLLAGEHGGIATWSLEAQAGQPPRLCAHQAQATALQLSLSHSHGWIACAVAPEPVGVDIEVVTHKPASTIADLAQLACTPAERLELTQIADPAQRQQRFVQLWSLKEAWFKQRGTGVDFALLPRLACLPAPAAQSAGGGGAHAWAWETSTPAGQPAVVSVCSSSPEAHWALHAQSHLPLPAAQRFCIGLLG